jgi:vacuolar protein sorting-associated protein 72
VQEYKQIEALLRHRYMWNEEASAWYGGEADLGAEGVEEVEGWAEAVHGGWYEGQEIVREVAEVEPTPEVVPEPELEATPEPKKRGPKRKSMAVEPKSNKRSKQATDPVSSPATHGSKRKK